MRNSIVRLLEKTNNISRSAYIWNAVNTFILALQTPVIMAIATRTNGEADAGIFSIAMAEANLMFYVGQYGLRRYQSSDIREDFKFCEYHAMRLITCAIMTAGCLAYSLFGIFFRSYTDTKFLIVVGICLIKVIMAYEDVLHGHLQQKNRLDIASKAATIRFSVELLIYVVGLILTKDLLLTVIVCVAVSFVVMMLTSYNATTYYCDTMKPSISREKFRLLAIEGFPLFVAMFLNLYIGNAPKYAIDSYMNDETQAIYNMIFMPTFAIQMLTQFIFNPVLTVYAELWLARSAEKFKTFIRMILNMCAVILGLTLFTIAVAATIGIPALSIIFGVDLTDYKLELCIIMFAGGMVGYSIYFNMLIAVIRAQRPLLYCYGVVAALAMFMSGIFVKHYGIMGAACIYAVLMTLLTLLLLVITVIPLKKEWDILKAGNGEQ